MGDLLNKIYPAHDELVVFTMTVSIIVLTVLDATFQSMIFNSANAVFVDFPTRALADGTWTGIKAFAAIGLVAVLSLACLFAGLYLPFTKRNLDAYIGLIVIAHALLICASNYLAWEAQRDTVSQAFFIASFLWFVGFSLRSRPKQPGESIVTTTHQQASVRQAAIASISVILLIVTLSIGFNMHWAHSYAITFAYAVGLTRLFETMSA